MLSVLPFFLSDALPPFRLCAFFQYLLFRISSYGSFPVIRGTCNHSVPIWIVLPQWFDYHQRLLTVVTCKCFLGHHGAYHTPLSYIIHSCISFLQETSAYVWRRYQKLKTASFQQLFFLFHHLRIRNSRNTFSLWCGRRSSLFFYPLIGSYSTHRGWDIQSQVASNKFAIVSET